MRKHFLILMLMALLPLAGWAGDTPAPAGFIDLTDGWKIRLSEAAKAYTGNPATSGPTIVLERSLGGDDYYVLSEGFTVTWSPNAPLDVVSGGYTVTITADDARTYGELHEKTAKFHVMKAQSAVTGAPAVKQGDWTYNLTAPVAKPVLTTPVSVTFGTVQYSIDNKVTWSTTIPTVQEVGVYTIWYKVEGTSNFNGIAATDALGAVTVNGTDLVEGTDYAVPTAKTGLTFSWDNGPVGKALVNPGSISSQKGTMKYRFRNHVGPGAWSAWMTTSPTASNAGEYDVQYMIEGATGYNDVAAHDLAASVTIAPKTPASVTPATGIANLEYAGVADPYQPLLSAAGSAADGATSSLKYKVRYKANAEIAWDAQPWLQEDVANYADIKGSDAGIYQVVTYVPAGGNYLAKEATPIEVVIAPAAAYTAAPSAKDLTWNNADQQLINAATDAVTNQVEYLLDTNPNNSTLDGTVWVTDPTTLVGADAGTYHVWYRVTNTNYQVKNPTKIVVTIKKKPLSVKVNNVTKTYDGTKNLVDEIYDADGAKTFNASLDGALNSSDPLTDPQATAYNAAMNPVSDKVAGNTLTAEEAADYNATLPYAVKTGDFKAPVNYTVEGGERFTFITPIPGADDFAALGAYDALTDDNINAGSYPGVINISGLEAINAAKHYFYEYTIIKGDLTVAKKEITVTANSGLEVTFGQPYDISKEYVISGYVAGEQANDYEKVFSTLPILTTNAAAVNPEAGDYSLSFTPGVLTNNYKMSNAGEGSDPRNGYVIGNRKFKVLPDANRKIVITVLPHTQKYTGVAESWDELEEGVDYIVSGLVSGDALSKAPIFTRGNATNYNAGEYTLTASGAEIPNLTTKYPGGFVYNNSTFTIEPVELTATVDPQTITTDANTADLANAALDKAAWTVKGLVGPDAETGKSVLGGTLSVNTTTDGTDAGQEKADLLNAGIYGWGIQLAITNTNYTLKAKTQYGELRIIAPSTIELNDTKDVTTALKAANNSTTTPITFNSRKLTKDTWNTLILPFDIKVRDLSAKLGYAVVDMLDESNTDPSKVIFKVATGTISANKPFMIKTDADVDLQGITFSTGSYTVKISYTNKTTCVAADKAGNKLTGAYKTQTVNEGEYYMTGSGNWKLCGEAFDLKGERVKFTKAVATSAAPTFYIEEGDGTMTVINGETTAIETISAEKLNAAEGWYTLDGVKLQSMPTQKGIYINNGKKVVIK
jgi:hypothetical protein